MRAVFWPNQESEDSAQRYQSFDPVFANCDLLLVEGDTQTSAAKLEVWRAAVGSPPRSGDLENVIAIVTDDPLETELPVLARAGVAKIADFILANRSEQKLFA